MQNQLKVCVINPNYYRSSGVTTAIKRIFEGAKGLSVDWFFVDCKYGNSVETTTPDWVSRNRYFEFSLMINNVFFLLKNIILFRRFLLRNKIQLIHIHHRRLAFLVKIASVGLKIPIVYTAQVTYTNSLFFRFASYTIDYAVAISESVRKNLLETTFIRNIELIYNPANFQSSVYENKYEVELQSVICVARLDTVKNHSNLIRAWKLVQPVPYKLVIVGEGNLKNDLIKLVEDLALTSNVFFYGYVANVSDLIEKSSFLVLTSFVEGHPLAVVEGAGLKRATLLTDVDGSRDCVPVTNILPNKVNPHSPKEIADALKIWLSEPDLVSEYGKVFYETWRDLAASEIVAEKYLKLFRKLAV